MGKYLVNGGNRLTGEVDISGSKNSSLAILLSTITVDGESLITNLPNITDVDVALEILEYYGADIDRISADTVKIDTTNICYRAVPEYLTVKMRASGYLLGALINRFGKCELLSSGGCDFGGRPMDLHLMALNRMGVRDFDGVLKADHRPKGNEIIFPKKTVGGTINTIIAATRAEGVTIIKNAAREPHVTDLSTFLNSCGAEIHGAGTNMVRIVGKNKLRANNYKVGSDMIEAGTYMIAALATSGRITCTNAPFNELSALIDVLQKLGATVNGNNNTISVFANKLRSTSVSTAPYPEFPTDLQPQICALLGISNGISSVTETVFDNRFAYIDQLRKFGLNCNIKNNTVKISGIPSYRCANVSATDLRGGAAALICALNAHGTSEILNSQLIERGYTNITQKLCDLGADIKKAD